MAPFKRRRAAGWLQTNEILPDGEPGYERDTGRLKIGNGVTPWADLPYFGEGAPPDGGGDSGEFDLPTGVPTFKGIWANDTEYKAGDMVKSAGVAWIAVFDNVGELPALPIPDVNPLTALAPTAVALETKPYSDPWTELGGWDHYYRYFDIMPGGSVVITPTACNVGKFRLLDSRDQASPSYGQVLYDSQNEGIPVGNVHQVHNLQPGRYVVENYAVNSALTQGGPLYVPTVIISGTNDAVIWGVDNSDAPQPSWVSLAPPVA